MKHRTFATWGGGTHRVVGMFTEGSYCLQSADGTKRWIGHSAVKDSDAQDIDAWWQDRVAHLERQVERLLAITERQGQTIDRLLEAGSE